jgi:hypothetical protein
VFRVAFIYIAEPYQCYHAASVASALARIPDFQVTEYVNFPETVFHLNKIRQDINEPELPVKFFKKSPLAKLLSYTKRFDHERIAVLRENIAELNSYDAIIATEYTAGILKTMGLDKPKLICIMHGAGDRLVNDEALIRNFDFTLLPGPKVGTYFQNLGYLDAQNSKVIGYPKFDVFDAVSKKNSFKFNNGKDFVFYNPHYQKEIKTYDTCLNKMIAGFGEQDTYNLLISPHIKIFHNGFGFYKKTLERKNSQTVFIDTGSPAMLDMTYTSSASIYIGDGSSQVYEFLVNPRPCIFLNPKKIEWRGNRNFLHWTLGEVVESPDQIMPAVFRAFDKHVFYRPLQERLFLETFGSPTLGASQRGAEAIFEYLTCRSGRYSPSPCI